MGIQLKSGKSNPHSEDLLYKNRAKLIPETLLSLDKHYGKNKTADKMSVVASFFHEKKESSTPMSDFVAQKFHNATKLRDSYLSTDRDFEEGMATAILMNLPDKYAHISTEIRANLPGSWRAIEARLLDFERMLSSEKKQEISGKSYVSQSKDGEEGDAREKPNSQAKNPPQNPKSQSKQDEKINDQKAQINAITSKITALKGDSGKGAKGKWKDMSFKKGGSFSHHDSRPLCWNCNKKGHTRGECWAKWGGGRDA